MEKKGGSSEVALSAFTLVFPVLYGLIITKLFLKNW